VAGQGLAVFAQQGAVLTPAGTGVFMDEADPAGRGVDLGGQRVTELFLSCWTRRSSSSIVATTAG
jgi:hypothetical protein